MKKVVIFDFDGVIVDTYDMVYSICNGDGFAITHKVLKAHHDGNVFDSPKIPFDKDLLKNYIEEYNLRLSGKYLFPIRETIKNLYKKYQLFIVSSNSEVAIKSFLNETRLSQYFSEVMGMETERSKVRKFNTIFDTYGTNKDDCVFITDTLGDVKEGKKVGIKTIATTWGFHEKERLMTGKPDIIIDKIDDIEKTVNLLLSDF